MSLLWDPSEEFLVAVQRPYRKGELIEARGVPGRIIEQISHQEYIEAWAYTGFCSEAISLSPKFYYRCKRTDDNLGDTVAAGSEPALRGDQESA